jgi:hypothetical protein
MCNCKKKVRAQKSPGPGGTPSARAGRSSIRPHHLPMLCVSGTRAFFVSSGNLAFDREQIPHIRKSIREFDRALAELLRKSSR